MNSDFAIEVWDPILSKASTEKKLVRNISKSPSLTSPVKSLHTGKTSLFSGKRKQTVNTSASTLSSVNDYIISYSHDFNLNTLNNDLLDIVRFMELMPKRAMTELGNIIPLLNSEKKIRWTRRWTDPRGLDLLHCAIVNSRADIIVLLLRDSKLFPETYFPKSNPYAHLAATIGCEDCLAAVLTRRPMDYFPTSQPEHVVKLPADISKRFNLGQGGGMLNKALGKVVKIARNQAASAKMTLREPIAVQSEAFEKELKHLSRSFKETTRKPRTRYDMSSRLKRNSFHPLVQIVKDEHQDIFQRTLRKKPVNCKVTVYSNAFFDGSLDIDWQKYDSKIANASHLSMDKQSLASIGPNSRQSRSVTPGRESHISRSGSIGNQERIEFGVRRIKKYKEFSPVFERKPRIEDASKYQGKTPLTMAAERDNHNCVRYLLTKFLSKKTTSVGEQDDSLTLATSEKSIEAMALILKNNPPFSQYQNSVLLSIREMYPDCLSVLLNLGKQNRDNLFEGTNLYHILFTRSIHRSCRYEKLPEMTRVLINNREDVNAKLPPKTYPLYTLIQCAFKVNKGGKSLYYFSCLKMLLNERANPHYDERIRPILTNRSTDVLNLSRPGYHSAIHCILSNAHSSLHYFEDSKWSHIILYKFIEAIEMHDITPRQVRNDIIFLYMSFVNELGLNRRVLRALLRYGGNPDHEIDGKYPLNAFFEEFLQFLTRFEVKHTLFTEDDTLSTLLFLSGAMRQRCLHQAVVHFLDGHLLSTPLQALGLTRKFFYHANKMIMSPRSLTHIASLFIWIYIRRNAKSASKLPISDEIIQLILP